MAESNSSQLALPIKGLSDEDEALLQKMLQGIFRYRMSVPAIFMLEAFSPLAVIGSQAMHFLSPIVGTVAATGDYDRLARLMERREVLEGLMQYIECNMDNHGGQTSSKKGVTADETPRDPDNNLGKG